MSMQVNIFSSGSVPTATELANFINELNTDLDSIVTLNTEQVIEGAKTFWGSKMLKFKQKASADKLGFTFYDYQGKEVGNFEYDNKNNFRLLALGNYYSATNQEIEGHVGFKVYNKSALSAYRLLCPLAGNAKNSISSLTDTYTNFYMPLVFTNGAASVMADNTGKVDLNTLIGSGGGDVSGLATVATTGNYNDLLNLPTLFSGSYNDLTGKPALFSGSYNDLTNKPTIPTVPSISTNIANDATSDTKTASPKAVKDFVESKGYLTQHQDISGKADQTDLEALEDRVEALKQSGSSTTIDTKLSSISTNSVQNKTLYDELRVEGTGESTFTTEEYFTTGDEMMYDNNHKVLPIEIIDIAQLEVVTDNTGYNAPVYKLPALSQDKAYILTGFDSSIGTGLMYPFSFSNVGNFVLSIDCGSNSTAPTFCWCEYLNSGGHGISQRSVVLFYNWKKDGHDKNTPMPFQGPLTKYDFVEFPVGERTEGGYIIYTGKYLSGNVFDSNISLKTKVLELDARIEVLEQGGSGSGDTTQYSYLKLIPDLDSYTEAPVGEIVKFTGKTGKYTRGWDYEKVQSGTSDVTIPAGTMHTTFKTNSNQAWNDFLANTSQDFYMYETVQGWSSTGASAWCLPNPKVGDYVYKGSRMCPVTAVNNFMVTFVRDGQTLTINMSENTNLYHFINQDGVSIYSTTTPAINSAASSQFMVFDTGFTAWAGYNPIDTAATEVVVHMGTAQISWQPIIYPSAPVSSGN